MNDDADPNIGGRQFGVTDLRSEDPSYIRTVGRRAVRVTGHEPSPETPPTIRDRVVEGIMRS